MLEERKTQYEVRRYYQAATEDYLKYYETDWHHHMHYGFDRDLPPGGNPTEHMVRYLEALARIRPGESVLDAGCGVGGSSIWLARERGCHCVGITLVESQAHLARGFSRARQVADARFAVNDFTAPAFKPASFDVVWAVESFDHAPDKEAWVKAMFQLLRPGGRLVIADGFRGRPATGAREAGRYARFLEGWAVPHLCSASELESYAARAGFELAHGEDLGRDVLPHALAIFRFGLFFIPLRWWLHKLGLTSREKLGNARATYYQYLTLRRGLWEYRAYCFRKPA